MNELMRTHLTRFYKFLSGLNNIAGVYKHRDRMTRESYGEFVKKHIQWIDDNEIALQEIEASTIVGINHMLCFDIECHAHILFTNRETTKGYIVEYTQDTIRVGIYKDQF